jgi:hypothetical protein
VSVGAVSAGIRHFGFGLWAPWWVVVSPSRGFVALRRSRAVVGVLLGIALTTGVAGGLSAPILVDLLEQTPQLAASHRVARAVVWFQAGVVGPFGAIAFLLATAVVVWVTCGVAGVVSEFSSAAVVALTSGVTGVLHKVFVSTVLYLRLIFRPDRLAEDVPSGVAAFVDLGTAPAWIAVLADHIGVFDVWYAVLLAVGMECCMQLPRRRAWICAGASFALVTLVRIAIDLVVR